MTKLYLYVKINTMNKYFNKTTKFLSIVVLSVVSFFCVLGLTFSTNNARANEQAISVNNFIPQSDLENLQLSSPIDVYSDDVVTAVVQDTQQLLIHTNQNSITPNITFTAIKQVKKLDDNFLLVSDNGSIYKIDLTQLDGNGTIKTPLFCGSDIVGGNFFDINPNFLVTAYSTKGAVYSRNNNQLTLLDTFTISDSTPIAINDNGFIFFVNSDGLTKYDYATHTYSRLGQNVYPTTMIANNEFIYYTYQSNIYKISVNGGESVPLSDTNLDANYDLGNINNPVGISFKNNNLLVVQDDTIQEFKIQNDKLIFTGFAIAKNKTAYNRISSSATEIEKVNNSFGVLDNNKLMIYQNNNLTDRYARENYKNFDFEIDNLNKSGIKPKSFALGTNFALLLYDDIRTLAMLNLTNGSLSDELLITTNIIIRDVCYQSGYFYVLCDKGNAPQHVYRVKEGDEQLTLEIIDNNSSTTEFTKFFVDVYANIYLANDNSISKLTKDDNYTQITSVIASDNGVLNNITKIQTDLLGNLFILSGKCIYRWSNQNFNKFDISNVNSFAFDFVDNDVFFINDSKEFIKYTQQLDNVSINDLVIPNSFNLKNPQGTFVADDNLEFYSLIPSSNAYVVKSNLDNLIVGDTFKFRELSSYTGEYVKICTIDYLGLAQFLVLANQDDIVLIQTTQAELIADKRITVVPDKVYVSTNANAYFLPIITKNDTYSFSNNNQNIRLEKTTLISPKHKVEFLGYDYYYAEFNYGGKLYAGYIACDFTVEVLTDDFVWDEYNIETIKKASVYKQDDMQELLSYIENETLVRVLKKDKYRAKIAYKQQDGTYQIGYIYTSDIVDNANIAIRNILIIIAVTACVCGTLTYFLLRKKKN